MVPILDMHADLFMDLTRRAELYRSNNGGKTPPPELGTRHLQRMKAGGIVGAVITDCRMAGESSEPMHLEQFIVTVRRELAAAGDRLIHVKSAADLEQALRTKTFAAIVGYEGLSPTKANWPGYPGFIKSRPSDCRPHPQRRQRLWRRGAGNPRRFARHTRCARRT